jgi:hypothetical protein
MLGSPITKYQAADIRARDAALSAWMKANKTNSYRREELPAEINPPTNDERSQCEIFEFLHDPPQTYFCYIVKDKESGRWIVSNWPGAPLSEGRVILGNEYRSNVGDKRRSVWFRAINGKCYAGTFYCGAGDYARVKMTKEK